MFPTITPADNDSAPNPYEMAVWEDEEDCEPDAIDPTNDTVEDFIGWR